MWTVKWVCTGIVRYYKTDQLSCANLLKAILKLHYPDSIVEVWE